jgi:hypothetical protein
MGNKPPQANPARSVTNRSNRSNSASQETPQSICRKRVNSKNEKAKTANNMTPCPINQTAYGVPNHAATGNKHAQPTPNP